jgi:hypothetical protein
MLGIHSDPFAPRRPAAGAPPTPELETAWFDASKRSYSSRPPKPTTPPPAPIDDPIADDWFR